MCINEPLYTYTSLAVYDICSQPYMYVAHDAIFNTTSHMSLSDQTCHQQPARRPVTFLSVCERRFELYRLTFGHSGTTKRTLRAGRDPVKQALLWHQWNRSRQAGWHKIDTVSAVSESRAERSPPAPRVASVSERSLAPMTSSQLIVMTSGGAFAAEVTESMAGCVWTALL